ncbi:hypothetical protein [Methanogenium cariaci]|nr:hypothetical protein [Methanogenium cariaci]
MCRTERGKSPPAPPVSEAYTAGTQAAKDQRSVHKAEGGEARGMGGR